jgi:hypothetical protein
LSRSGKSDEGERAWPVGPNAAVLQGPDGAKLVPYVVAEPDDEVPEGARLFVEDEDGFFRPRRGPVRVTTPAYRAGWDAVFGKQPIGEA